MWLGPFSSSACEHLLGFGGQPPGKAEDNLRPAGKENAGVYTCERGCFFFSKINCITRVEKRL